MSEIRKGTRIDLGDDLLVTKTDLVAKRSQPEDSVRTPDSVEEFLVNAKILMNEGLIEDAKKTLRKALRIDPESLGARDRLEEIQKIEIKALLSSETKSPRGFVKRKKDKIDFSSEDGALVAEALERELGSTPSQEENFFGTPEAQAGFLLGIENLCAGASARDRLDLGIGFLELELFEVAIRIFQSTVAMDPFDRRARALLATAWIARGSGFEAMMEIEMLISDQSVPEEERTEYGYLAGRAQELLGNIPNAMRWYRAVLQIDSSYRDGVDRLARCMKFKPER